MGCMMEGWTIARLAMRDMLNVLVDHDNVLEYFVRRLLLLYELKMLDIRVRYNVAPLSAIGW
jgi:hypothetical protein